MAGMLTAGWTVEELRAALAASPTAADAPDQAAQENGGAPRSSRPGMPSGRPSGRRGSRLSDPGI